jgi:UTP-glucose-1-phosphate uridylyltransferase/mevalonate kinase
MIINSQPEKINLFVPGRLCLFGEHSDWAGLHRVINADIVPGVAIVTGIEQGIYAEVEKCEQFILHNISEELSGFWVDFSCPMQSVELRAVAETDSYFSYAAGVASYVKDHYSVGGVKVTIKKMTLPVKKGLSSSAAICVLIARAFNKLYSLNLNNRGEMDIAYKGEQRTRSRCGRLDQACAFGIVPVCMHFNGDDITIEKLIIKNYFYWVFADLNAKKNTIKILNDLNKCYPFAETEKERNVHKALGELNQDIINRAIECLQKGKSMELGKLMSEAQEIFDLMIAPASPLELSAPKLHAFLHDENVQSLTFGGKGVGSQGDGSIQFLAKNAEAQESLCNYLNENGLISYKLTIKPCHKIRKAIIPIAGYGTRLYPMTRWIKKEMLPLVDKDGLVKPALLILLEQLNDAGIEEICLIVGGEDDIRYYQNIFKMPIADEHLNKLSESMKNYEQRIQNIGNKVNFRIQKERLGFGHAVYQCLDFCDGEPVLLLLGDTIYSSNEKINCSQQIIELYNDLEKPLIAIHKIPLQQVNNYGILSGKWLNNTHTLMDINLFVEKPDSDYAKEHLFTLGKDNNHEYYSVFGQYIINPELFNVLGDNINKEQIKQFEVDMTDSLKYFIGKGLTGVVLNGTMYDIGNPLSYQDSFLNYGMT